MADDQNVMQDPDPYTELVAEGSPYLICDACGYYPIEPVHGHFYCPSCFHQTRCCEGAPLKTKRIGIYSGTFDPVHAGHVTFALQALEQAKLDRVYFLPERQPRGKQGVEHFAHRVAMLKRAARPHPRFGVLELTDIKFTPERTIPKLRSKFGDAQLVFLFGSDVITQLPEWPRVDCLLTTCELIIGLRDNTTRRSVESRLAAWAVKPKRAVILTSAAPSVSSRSIRDALRRRSHVHGLLTSVRQYSNQHWLYVSLA